ncbi:MAG: hypothetical protein ABL994_17700, partial [Verrucomicrobiales bacterium]
CLAAGFDGAKPSELATTSKRQSDEFQAALNELQRSGELVAVPRGRSTVYYSCKHAPDPEADCRKEIESRLSNGTAWVESALVGAGEGAALKRRILEKSVREGRIIQFLVQTSARAQATAYRLAEVPSGRQGEIKSARIPTWSEIEREARVMSSVSLDGTASFETLAEKLGTTPLVVKTAVMQEVEREGPVQLVQGEAREFRHPATAGLNYHGVVYFRFRFID